MYRKWVVIMNNKEKLVEATVLALQGKLVEANPSALKKPKVKNRDIHYGAEGQPAWSEYAVPFDYTLHAGDYEGYIDDKQGKRYIVSASYNESDTGHIAGGTTHYYVYIAYGEHKITLKSYTAIFSNNDGPGYRLISDLQDGMYLEDYLQKYLKNIESVSNIPPDFKPDTEYNWEIPRLFVKQYIIGDNETYDDRTKKQRGIDKKNEFEYVRMKGCYIYIDGKNVMIAKKCEANKMTFIGKNEFREVEHGTEKEIINIPEGTKIVLPNEWVDYINNVLTTPSDYSFSFTPSDYRNVALRLHSKGYYFLDIIFKIDNNVLKPVKQNDKKPNVDVCYSYIYNERENLGNCAKLDELEKQYKIGVNDYYGEPIETIYKKIEMNIRESEKRGVKEAIVEIVYDNSKKEYRAQGDDGYHGKAWVQFPTNLRQEGKRYKVDELIWNGKNYRAKGNIEEV